MSAADRNRGIRDNPPYLLGNMRGVFATPRSLKLKSPPPDRLQSVGVSGAIASVGTDRWAVREYPDGAPSGHALPPIT